MDAACFLEILGSAFSRSRCAQSSGLVEQPSGTTTVEQYIGTASRSYRGQATRNIHDQTKTQFKFRDSEKIDALDVITISPKPISWVGGPASTPAMRLRDSGYSFNQS
jgi:hypothetical protein